MVAASSLLILAIVVVIAARGIGGTSVPGAETDGACHESGAACSPHRPLPQEHLLLQMSSNRGSAEVQRHDMSAADDTPIIGFPNSGDMQASGLWCSVPAPPDQWNLKTCPFSRWAFAKTRVKVLTYNLFWWNLFGRRGGDGRSAGKLIAQTAGSEGYDLMGFQECDDRSRILGDAKAEGLQGDWEALDGGRALGLMYRKDRFQLLESGAEDVGEDSSVQWYGKRSAVWVRLRHVDGTTLGLMYRKDRFQLLESGAEDVGEDSSVQWYGKRSAVWVRLRHVDGTTVFFINHHGPLPVSASGGCTGSATAHNIMRVIATHAHAGDAIILTGDFNAEPSSSRIQELSKRLYKIYSGTSMGGVDHIFSNCGNWESGAQGNNLGTGGSDHDALSVTFNFR
eukprot:CAMPEP_0204248440 /NCGR_PEP_ID=MMETSP0361-20130328/99163_1 /ASSEMBLY_ACC=CAM_ASM_000343 /TAXON_ID=268821 /ORGANISM="Scrippsiella Hangoei, Strain SHTV-5" /LENGTH=395 /DNA_ID=CAMNT_0051221703 /DNA_START=51 /DNA_END=1237 /DNA_ORIENTATION=-